MILNDIFLQNHIFNKDILYSDVYKNGTTKINKYEHTLCNILMGIEIKNTSFESIKIKKDNILFSKIYPHHFIKLDDNSYVSHFFHQPLPLVSIIYDDLFIESSIDYRLIFVNVDIQTIKILLKEPLTINALDFWNIKIQRGHIFGETDNTHDIMYVLSNYKYVQQLLCLIKNKRKNIEHNNANMDTSYTLDLSANTWG